MIKKLIIVGTGNTSAQISRLISVNEFKGIRKDSIKGYLSFNKKEKIITDKNFFAKLQSKSINQKSNIVNQFLIFTLNYKQ